MTDGHWDAVSWHKICRMATMLVRENGENWMRETSRLSTRYYKKDHSWAFSTKGCHKDLYCFLNLVFHVKATFYLPNLAFRKKEISQGSFRVSLYIYIYIYKQIGEEKTLTSSQCLALNTW